MKAILIGGALGVILGGLAVLTGGFTMAGFITMAKGAAAGAAIGWGVGKAAQAYGKVEAGDVMGEAGGVTQISTKSGGLYGLRDDDEFAAGPDVLRDINRGQQSSAPVVNVDMKQVTDALVPEIKNMVGLLSMRNEEARDQAKRQKRATEDSGKTR